MLDKIEITLRNVTTGNLHPVYIDVFDNTLSRKWLPQLENLLNSNYHLEKNYCFLGFSESARNIEFLVKEINQLFLDINNNPTIDYHIDDHFTVENCTEKMYSTTSNSYITHINHDKFNQLHLYFEDTQGVSGAMSKHYLGADQEGRWLIRQLNLLCHEAEYFIMSKAKRESAPDWIRPSNIMCWLNAPRFTLDDSDLELFGVDTIARDPGGVYVGVNKAVGKHHWEVYQDEGRDSRIDELTTTTLKPQTEAAGDFDIEWGKSPKNQPFMNEKLDGFREWLIANKFDPEDKSLTIGFPKVAQVDLTASFGSKDFHHRLSILTKYLDVYSIKTSNAYVEYDYTWRDSKQLQVPLI